MRPFQIVDVFATAPFGGNPVAVVFAAEDIETEMMQRITRWFNLSETTFLLPPSDASADYRVRIFTLDRELPFAGHPTLGTCHAWLKAGGTPKQAGTIVQECPAGLIAIRQGPPLAFAAPPTLRDGPLSAAERADAIAAAGIDEADVVDAAWVDNGPGWRALLLRSAASVLSARPAAALPARMDLGLVGPHAAGGDAAWEIRALFSDPTGAFREDPMTGSLNASVAQWLRATGRAPREGYVAAQGTVLGRAGRITVSYAADGGVWIGGETVSRVAGELA